MSWFTQWLPALPSIDFTLPSGLQRRFISFALRQTLGHFLQPGQLDVLQIDSQIGSGYVQIRDVELDNEAINALISGLPLQLHDGSIGKVTARVPLPNPLTSSVGLSIESFHLTFHLAATAPKTPRPSFSSLAESVASVADTFIHEELNLSEISTPFDSPDTEPGAFSHYGADNVPGGLDPFMPDSEEARSDMDPPGVSIFATLLERLLSRFHFDASDIQITLVQPGSASFTLKVPEVRYGTSLDPPSSQRDSYSSSNSSTPEAILRTLVITGAHITTRCLRPRSTPSHIPSFTPSNVTPTTHHPSPIQSPSTPVSSSSDIDEDTQIFMSQSLVTLPPRPISPSSSASGSLYESALSTAIQIPEVIMEESEHQGLSRSSSAEFLTRQPPTISATPLPHPPPELRRKASLRIDTEDLQDETLLSLGSEPIVIRLLTPNAIPGSSTSDKAQEEKNADRFSTSPLEALKVDVTVGIVACCVKAHHLRSLLDLADIWTSHAPPDPLPVQSSTAHVHPFVLDTLNVTVNLRGIVLLISPSSSTIEDEGMQAYWNDPVAPPHLASSLVRVHLDNFYAFVTVTDGLLANTAVYSQRTERRLECSLTLRDFSILAFKSSATNTITDHITLPILITDPHLIAQYAGHHVHPDLSKDNPESRMPSFDIVDWTRSSHTAQSVRLSYWRSKSPQARTTRHQGEIPLPRGSPGSPPRSQSEQRESTLAQYVDQPALKATVTVIAPKTRTSSSRSRTRDAMGSSVAECTVVPLHFFVDVGLVLESKSGEPSPCLQFLEELMAQDVPFEAKSYESGYQESSEDDDNAMTPPGGPQATDIFTTHEREREKERRRLEQLVIEDLDLDFDYRQNVPERRPSLAVRQSRSARKRGRKFVSNNRITINMPMIRIQIRVPPPPSSSARSGALIVDLHSFQLSPGEPVVEKQIPARFSESAAPNIPDSAGNVLVTAFLSRIVVAYCQTESTTAVALVSLGNLSRLPTEDRDDKGVEFDLDTSARMSSLAIPRIVVSKSDPNPKRSLSSVGFVTTAVSVDVPSVFVHISKPQLDGIQLWADDLSQSIERAFSEEYGDDDDATERRSNKNPSLIGSRFFAKTQRSRIGAEGSSTLSTEPAITASETIVKILVHKVAVRIALPRTQDERSEVRSLDVLATDVDMLLEVKPEGKDETVLTLGMMDVSFYDHTHTGKRDCYLALTIPREHVQSSKPLLKLRFTSLIIPNTVVKESKIKVTLCGFTYNFYPDIAWIMDLASFVKAPPGAFETVVPSERTHISFKVIDTSIRAFALRNPGSVVLYLGETEFATTLVGNSSQTTLRLTVTSLSIYLADDIAELSDMAAQLESGISHSVGGVIWKKMGYTLLTELTSFITELSRDTSFIPPDTRVLIDQGDLRLHLCADTATALTAFIVDLTSAFATPMYDQAPQPLVEKPRPVTLGVPTDSSRELMASLDEHAFARAPDLISAPDMISDDLPTNLDYLDESFSAAAGLRELTDDDLDEFGIDNEDYKDDPEGLVSKYGGETIRLLHPHGLQIIEHHFDSLPPDTADDAPQPKEVIFKLRARHFGATLFLYDGYDWARTRRIIEEERKNMRRKLAKIRQLVASGQTPDPSVEETNTLLFNSVYIGLEHNLDELEPDALLAAIDEELNEDQETASQSSWQSFVPPSSPKSSNSSKVPKQPSHLRQRVSKRSRAPSIEFRFTELNVDFDQYRDDPTLASRVLVTVRDVEILDHIKTSTWRKFLTALTTDSKGNIRETDSNMVRVELRQVYPSLGHSAQEARLRMKLLPLRLHVDQDALDFLKKFFSFKDPGAVDREPSTPSEETYFQQAEVFPVDLKLDYKPRRVDYRALRDGRTIELMNFFHFDGAEMTLRHITLTGITGWAKVFDLLNDLWTPDVKATQLVEVISGVAPIRSVVNVGSGVADLVLLPIAQYRKDGRVVRGLQKGTKAFVKSTATEAIKLGARLATGTQVILEQAENVLGGQFKDPITAETMPLPTVTMLEELADEDTDELISRYADQPTNVKEGVQSAYQSLRRNFNSAAQTILAVPMEVYERSGNEGTVRAVVRAVPIAVLKPMIGASEAISKTLLGLHNTLDPGVRLENEAKYKQR